MFGKIGRRDHSGWQENGGITCEGSGNKKEEKILEACGGRLYGAVSADNGPGYLSGEGKVRR